LRKRITYGLKELTFAYYGEKADTIIDATGGQNTLVAIPSAVANYCGADCRNTWRLYERAMSIIKRDEDLNKLTWNIDNPCNLVVSEMMWTGVKIDLNEAQRQIEIYRGRIQQCRDLIWAELQCRDPLETPKQVIEVLKRLNLEERLGFDPFVPEFELDERERLIYARDVTIKKEYLLELFDRAGTGQAQRVIALFLAKWQMEQRISAFFE